MTDITSLFRHVGGDLSHQSEFNHIWGVSLAKNSMAFCLARNSRTNMKTRLKTIACELTSFFCVFFEVCTVVMFYLKRLV